MVNSLYNVPLGHGRRRKPLRATLERWDQLDKMEWVSFSCRNFEIPKHAVMCHQFSTGAFYIIRAEHMNSYTPGYLDTLEKACYIVWGGNKIKKMTCEVLCTPGEYVPCSDTNILLRATRAGISEQGEPLYIGRVKHEGNELHGKVQRSHGVCYVPIDRQEVAFYEYDVFIKSEAPPYGTPQA